MNWSDRINNGFVIDGTHYPVTHLKAFRHDYHINKKKIKCYIVLESHCVSSGLGHNASTQNHGIPDSHLVIDKRGNPRRFCKTRYQASFNLKELIKNLTDFPFYEGAVRSENVFFVNLNKDDPDDIYKIIINFVKARNENYHLRINVESAFVQYRPEDPLYDENTAVNTQVLKRLPRMLGKVILEKAYSNEKIKFAKKRR
ncbi:hypothetical protein JCM30760_26290 [Thiomicrorhabdus hydrogeniphila]